ncbi:hypothetical protein BRADI_1g36167v3 [Brachypodium distachyon]|uniref:Uncharacterized protein n=1 Tax=Brachypodium distachyon TaxID=15368 RepID=A0A0Q3RYJ1_BRADI|nr:hypothetical protein BRADI_1g36167v3 [Brachypodium distachyon]
MAGVGGVLAWGAGHVVLSFGRRSTRASAVGAVSRAVRPRPPGGLVLLGSSGLCNGNLAERGWWVGTRVAIGPGRFGSCTARDKRAWPGHGPTKPGIRGVGPGRHLKATPRPRHGTRHDSGRPRPGIGLARQLPCRRPRPPAGFHLLLAHSIFHVCVLATARTKSRDFLEQQNKIMNPAIISSFASSSATIGQFSLLLAPRRRPLPPLPQIKAKMVRRLWRQRRPAPVASRPLGHPMRICAEDD